MRHLVEQKQCWNCRRFPKENNRTSIFFSFARRGTAFAILSVCSYVLIAVVKPEAAYGQDAPAQAVPAKESRGAEEGSSTAGRAAVPQAPEEQTAQQGETKTEQDQASKDDNTTSEKKGEWLLAPIPINSPAIGSGLEWAVARVFPFNKRDAVSPPSTVGIAGIFTNNGSRGVAIGGKLYLKEDKFRVAAGIANATINFDLYGIGKTAGSQGFYIPLTVKGSVGIGELLYKLKKGVYVGARGQYRNASMGLDQDRLESTEISFQPPEQIAKVIDQVRDQLLHQTTVSLGPRFQWDTRDSVFYPKRGVILEVASDFFSTGLGSKWSYQYYRASFNKYATLSEHQILAFRGMGCAAAGDRVPIYDLCLFGTMNDLRGYPGGRYQDRRMFATQAEYRLMMPAKGFLGKFGIVAFGGVGAVGNKFTEIAGGDLLPAGGGGLRFRLLKKYPINFRVDYGIGKDGHTLSIGVLEAF